jgi:hypothetical protein
MRNFYQNLLRILINAQAPGFGLSLDYRLSGRNRSIDLSSARVASELAVIRPELSNTGRELNTRRRSKRQTDALQNDLLEPARQQAEKAEI